MDLIIEIGGGRIVLIRRRNPPPGWALPGGFLEYGESLEQAAVREAKERKRPASTWSWSGSSTPTRTPIATRAATR